MLWLKRGNRATAVCRLRRRTAVAGGRNVVTMGLLGGAGLHRYSTIGLAGGARQANFACVGMHAVRGAGPTHAPGPPGSSLVVLGCWSVHAANVLLVQLICCAIMLYAYVGAHMSYRFANGIAAQVIGLVLGMPTEVTLQTNLSCAALNA